MIDIHNLVHEFSYLAIFILMLTNGVMNFPSSQLLYLIAGYFVSTKDLLFLPTVIAGTLGNTIGNIITFYLVRKHGESIARKLLMVDEKTFAVIHTTLLRMLSKKGMWWIFIGKLTPSLKAFVPVATGLATTPPAVTSFLFLIASGVWGSGLVFLGYYFGEHVSLSSLFPIALLIGGVVCFVIYKEYKKTLSSK